LQKVHLDRNINGSLTFPRPHLPKICMEAA